MIKPLLFVVVPLLIAGFSHPGADQLPWSETYHLKWEDFQAAPDSNAFGSALTTVTIKARPNRQNRRLEYDINAFFLRSHSWSKTRSIHVLNHEQIHFDLAELYARKARKKVQELQQLGINDYRVYNSALQAIFQESNEMDAKYDRETLNGALLKKQISWDLTIGTHLKELYRYRKQD